MKAKWVFWIIALVFLIILASSYVKAIPVGGEFYYNFSVYDDLWNDNSIANTGAASIDKYPTFNNTGNSRTNSSDFDGGTDFLLVALNTSWYANNDFSYSTWFNTTDSGSIQMLGMNWQTVDADSLRWQMRLETDGKASLYMDGAVDTSAGAYNDGTWHNFIGVFDDSDNTFKGYVDGALVLTRATTAANTLPNVGLAMGANTDGSGSPFLGQIDESKFFSKALNITEILNMYNYGNIDATIPPVPNGTINFVSQSPADITNTNLFSSPLNITYNTTLGGVTNMYLNYTVNHSEGSGCIISINQTCFLTAGMFTAFNYTDNSTGDYDFVFDADVQIYPSTNTLPMTTFESNTHSAFSLTNSNIFIKTKLENVSGNESNSFLELMVNETTSTSDLEVFYCNSTYTTGNPSINANCAQFATVLPDIPYNHSHNTNSSHILLTFPSTGGTINGVGITSTSYFLLSPTTGSSAWSAWYISDETTPTTTQTSNANGNSWTSQTYTVDMHLHQFGGTDYISYQSCVDNGTIACSGFRNDTLQGTVFPPTTPQIHNPSFNESTNAYLFINYTNSTFYNSTGAYYNISLLNFNRSFNRTIITNNSLATTYNWSVYAENLTLGNYLVEVKAVDLVNGLETTDTQVFNLLTNAVLNITAFEIITNTSISTFQGWVYDYNTTSNTSYSTTTGQALVPTIRGNYVEVYLVTANNYSESYTDTNLSQSSIHNLSIYTYLWNSIYFEFRDLLTDAVINTTNISLELISGVYSVNYTTANGTLYASLLVPTTYNARASASAYATNFQSITVSNGTGQTVTMYLTNATLLTNISIKVIDESAFNVEGAIVKALRYDVATNSYLLQSSGQTDFEGNTMLQLTFNDEYYRFIIEYGGESKLTTNPAYITSTSIVFQITLLDPAFDDFNDYRNLDYTFLFNETSDNFRLVWNTFTGLDQNVCVNVYTATASGETLYNNSCASSASGVLLVGVAPVNGTTYIGKFLANTVTVDTASHTYPLTDNAGQLGIFLQVLITLAFVLFAISADIVLAPIALSLSLIMGRLVHLNTLGWGSIITIFIITAVVIFFIRRK